MAARSESVAATSTARRSRAEAASSFQQTVELLGGTRVLHLHGDITSDEDAHELVSQGIPAAAMTRLFDGVVTLSFDAMLGAVGVSERSFARRKAAPKARLPLDESERVWRFAEILAQATRVLGSQLAAEQWLNRPAYSLGHRKPIDLVTTHPGARLVSQYLTRIEYGVYT